MTVTQREVTADEAELRLDRWFRRHYPAVTQGAIQKLCRTGQVRVDGRRVDAATRLLPGQSIRVPPLPDGPAPISVPPVDPATRDYLDAMVLYRDEAVIVLDKPPGLPTQGGPGITRHLDGMLDALRDGGDRPRLVHRLDRDTSGALVVARTPGIAAKLAAAFRTRAVHKTYWAVVAGRPVPPDGRVDHPLVRMHGSETRAALAESGDKAAAYAITDYRTLDHAARRAAWLELSPLTGRTHQLRVHCAALGAPIVGDVRYGSARNTDSRGWRNTALVEGLSDRLHLHARALHLPHPAGGTLDVAAPLPEHMRETFRLLGFQASPPTPAQRSA